MLGEWSENRQNLKCRTGILLCMLIELFLCYFSVMYRDVANCKVDTIGELLFWLFKRMPLDLVYIHITRIATVGK